MVRPVSKAALIKQMETRFPDRWEVTRLETRVEAERILGAIKIHCREDNKVFLSDFSVKLDGKGRITEFTLDGVNVGKFIGRLHEPSA
jgi:hypothetical protein